MEIIKWSSLVRMMKNVSIKQVDQLFIKYGWQKITSDEYYNSMVRYQRGNTLIETELSLDIRRKTAIICMLIIAEEGNPIDVFNKIMQDLDLDVEVKKYKYFDKSGQTIKIRCPFCGIVVKAHVWSLAGSGKRCPECGAVHHGHKECVTVKKVETNNAKTALVRAHWLSLIKHMTKDARGSHHG